MSAGSAARSVPSSSASAEASSPDAIASTYARPTADAASTTFGVPLGVVDASGLPPAVGSSVGPGVGDADEPQPATRNDASRTIIRLRATVRTLPGSTVCRSTLLPAEVSGGDHQAHHEPAGEHQDVDRERRER